MEIYLFGRIKAMLRKESGKLKQSKIIVKSSSNLEIYLAKKQIKLCIIFIYLHIMGASVVYFSWSFKQFMLNVKSSKEIFELNCSNWTFMDNWSDLWQIDFGQFYSLECPSIPIVLLKSYILLAQVELQSFTFSKIRRLKEFFNRTINKK